MKSISVSSQADDPTQSPLKISEKYSGLASPDDRRYQQESSLPGMQADRRSEQNF
jgi:hypothetical protein